MAKYDLSDILRALEQLSKDELMQMIAGQLSVPHAHRTKQKLLHFIIEHGSEELLWTLKERAERKLGKKRERSSESLQVASHKRICLG